MKKQIEDILLEILRGDIASQPDYEAVVNAANAQLKPGGGVAGAIHGAAGPELDKECRKFAPIKPGESVITNAYKLPNDKVVHCLGPVYGQDEPSDELLSKCYETSLRMAEEEGIKSIAFPAISTGAFGYPMEEAAEISLKTVLQKLEELCKIQKIGFILYSDKAVRIHTSKAERLLKNLY